MVCAAGRHGVSDQGVAFSCLMMTAGSLTSEVSLQVPHRSATPAWVVSVVGFLDYMTKSMLWTPARRTSHYKTVGINMELVPPLGFPLDVGILLRGLASIQPQALVR